MNERGQVFTLDMFFALTLTLLVVSYSGLALEQARRQAEGYALRYSLERAVNDAADVLVKTLGRPYGWENDITTLETPGLAEENNGEPVQNTIDIRKLSWIRELSRAENWDPTKSEVQAIMALFGGSENFEIRITSTETLAREKLDEGEEFKLKTTLFGLKLEVEAENEGAVIEVDEFEFGDTEKSGQGTDFTLSILEDNVLVEVIVKGGWIEVGYRTTPWDIWPGWNIEASSGVENSLEVAVVRRSVVMRFGNMAAKSGKIGLGDPGLVIDNLEFEIPVGGLDTFDWYIVVTTGSGSERREEVKIYVNRAVNGGYDYKFKSKKDKLEDTFPDKHGGIEDDLPGRVHEGLNYISLKVTAGNAEAWVKVYIIALPACSPWGIASLAKNVLPATLEVKLWR